MTSKKKKKSSHHPNFQLQVFPLCSYVVLKGHMPYALNEVSHFLTAHQNFSFVPIQAVDLALGTLKEFTSFIQVFQFFLMLEINVNIYFWNLKVYINKK